MYNGIVRHSPFAMITALITLLAFLPEQRSKSGRQESILAYGATRYKTDIVHKIVTADFIDIVSI